MSKLAVLLAALAFVAVGCGGGDEGAEPAGGNETVAQSKRRSTTRSSTPWSRTTGKRSRWPRPRPAAGCTQPDLEKIASDIVSSQQREIDQMLDWREQWFGSRQLGPVLPDVLGVPESELGMEHGSADEVAGAVDVDAKFAEMMIPHHEGAIAMAEAAKERAHHDELKELADAIIEAQEREIGIMEEHASGMEHG